MSLYRCHPTAELSPHGCAQSLHSSSSSSSSPLFALFWLQRSSCSAALASSSPSASEDTIKGLWFHPCSLLPLSGCGTGATRVLGTWAPARPLCLCASRHCRGQAPRPAPRQPFPWATSLPPSSTLGSFWAAQRAQARGTKGNPGQASGTITVGSDHQSPLSLSRHCLCPGLQPGALQDWCGSCWPRRVTVLGQSS